MSDRSPPPLRVKKQFGFEKLASQMRSYADGMIDTLAEEWQVGDSEIERLFFLSIKMLAEFRVSEFSSIAVVGTEEDESRFLNDYPIWASPLFCVRPQAKIQDYRVDFLIHVEDRREVMDSTKKRWCRLVVECDGHDFHERTKEQAARDRSRDRDLTSWGYDVFRFTGSELWTNPFDCAQQVLAWGVKTW